MTDDEWEAIAYVIEEGFGDFPPDKRRVYRMFLDSYEPEAVLASLHRYALTGKPFMPKVPELVKAVRDVSVPPVPSWSEAWALIQRTMSRAGRKRPAVVGEREAMEWLRSNDQAHPAVAAFVDVEDLHTLCMTQFWDPDWGAVRVRQLEQRWESFVHIANERLDRGLALESSARRAIGPTRFDPAKALGFIQDARRLHAGES